MRVTATVNEGGEAAATVKFTVTAGTDEFYTVLTGE